MTSVADCVQVSILVRCLPSSGPEYCPALFAFRLSNKTPRTVDLFFDFCGLAEDRQYDSLPDLSSRGDPFPKLRLQLHGDEGTGGDAMSVKEVEILSRREVANEKRVMGVGVFVNAVPGVVLLLKIIIDHIILVCSSLK